MTADDVVRFGEMLDNLRSQEGDYTRLMFYFKGRPEYSSVRGMRSLCREQLFSSSEEKILDFIRHSKRIMGVFTYLENKERSYQAR